MSLPKPTYMHADGECISIPRGDGTFDTLNLTEHDMHSYLRKERFYHVDYNSLNDPKITALCANPVSQTRELSWPETKDIIDKVHRHVCGHFNFRDIRILLERNGLWRDDCYKYLSHVLESCLSCHETKLPQKAGTVSLNNISREFNQLVFVDHFFLDDLDVFYAMDAKTCYSCGAVVGSVSMKNAVTAMESNWMNHFWAPDCVQADPAFGNSEFGDYLSSLGTKFRPSPPRRHNKNAIESKHRVIRDVYIRLQAADPDGDRKLHALQAIRISNDLYGNDIASAHELVKGFTRPAIPGHPSNLPPEILEAHDLLVAKRKLNAILRSKATVDKQIKEGDLVQIFVKHSNAKRGAWSLAKPVLKYDSESQTVTVAGAKGKYQKAAIEATRFAVPQEMDVAVAIQEAIDECSSCIDEVLDELSEQRDYLADDDGLMMPAINESVDEDESGFDNSENHVVPSLPVPPPAEVDPDELTYFPVVESTFDPDAPTTPDRDFTGRVGTREISELQPVRDSEPQMLTRSQAATNRKSQMTTRSQTANEVELSPGTELCSSEQEMLRDYQERFNSKEFLLSHAQGLPTSVTQNAYSAEECSFLANCECVHISRVPSTANVISSHVLYKIKELDDEKLLCKARIAPHGNKDFEKDNLKTDSASCPPLGVRILLSICTLLHWFPRKVDIKAAFLQSGPATRDVYVIPPRECPDRQFRWRLLVASYGLVNANAKWQLHSDTTLLDLGLHAVVLIPQLFYMKQDGKLCLIVAKVVDDFLIGGTKSAREWLIDKLKAKYSVGTIAHLPGSFHFFGLLITQKEDGTITVSAEEKLQAITPHLLSRMRRKEGDDHLNAIEAHSFVSINGSMGFLGQNVSPFASFYNSYLQQRRGRTTVHDLIKQSAIVKKLKTLGTQSTFRCPIAGTFGISVVMFVVPFAGTVSEARSARASVRSG